MEEKNFLNLTNIPIVLLYPLIRTLLTQPKFRNRVFYPIRNLDGQDKWSLRNEVFAIHLVSSPPCKSNYIYILYKMLDVSRYRK